MKVSVCACVAIITLVLTPIDGRDCIPYSSPPLPPPPPHQPVCIDGSTLPASTTPFQIGITSNVPIIFSNALPPLPSPSALDVTHLPDAFIIHADSNVSHIKYAFPDAFLASTPHQAQDEQIHDLFPPTPESLFPLATLLAESLSSPSSAFMSPANISSPSSPIPLPWLIDPSLALSSIPARGFYLAIHPTTLSPHLSSSSIFPPLSSMSHPPTSPKPAPYPPTLWMGSGGLAAHTHYDSSHNVFAHLWGEKTFFLSPHSESKGDPAYPFLHPGTRLSQGPPMDKDSAQMVASLVPGDMLYLPPFWWHTVMADTSSISLNVWTPVRKVLSALRTRSLSSSLSTPAHFLSFAHALSNALLVDNDDLPLTSHLLLRYTQLTQSLRSRFPSLETYAYPCPDVASHNHKSMAGLARKTAAKLVAAGQSAAASPTLAPDDPRAITLTLAADLLESLLPPLSPFTAQPGLVPFFLTSCLYGDDPSSAASHEEL